MFIADTTGHGIQASLRTMVLKGQTVYLQAGAGIVADSIPAREYEETLNKAMGLLRALEIAEKQL